MLSYIKLVQCKSDSKTLKLYKDKLLDSITDIDVNTFNRELKYGILSGAIIDIEYFSKINDFRNIRHRIFASCNLRPNCWVCEYSVEMGNTCKYTLNSLQALNFILEHLLEDLSNNKNINNINITL